MVKLFFAQLGGFNYFCFCIFTPSKLGNTHDLRIFFCKCVGLKPPTRKALPGWIPRVQKQHKQPWPSSLPKEDLEETHHRDSQNSLVQQQKSEGSKRWFEAIAKRKETSIQVGELSKLPLFSYGRDGHQPYSRGLYTHYKDSLLKVEWPSPI